MKNSLLYALILSLLSVTEKVWAESEVSLVIGAMGDMPYGKPKQWHRLRKNLKQNPLDLTVHLGDIKSGSSRCDNKVYEQMWRDLNELPGPVIYTPGDNEWTDCYRESAGSYQPKERLQFIRATFMKGDKSLGKQPIILQRQSRSKGFQLYSENVKFSLKGIMIGTLHVVGSNNNRGRNKLQDDEFFQRNHANLSWLHEIFKSAKQDQSHAIVIMMHGNPIFAYNRSKWKEGYRTLNDTLIKLTKKFKGEVLLVHGDSHRYRVDKPFRTKGGSLVKNLTRVEVFGDKDVHWVLIKITAGNPKTSFLIEPMIVEKNN